MQGHAKVSTFEHIGMDPATKPMLAEMQNADGTPKVCERVWISSIGCADTEQTGKLTAGFGASQNGPKIGPEFTFGLYMEKFTDAPILLIKTAWGGKSLNTDFRPPSAGPYVFNETQLAAFQKQGKDLAAIKAEKEKETGVYYRLMVEHVKKVLGDIKRVVPDYDAAQGYELAGFVWFQGWNDMVDGGTYPNRDKPGGYDAYSEAMAHFIRDVRQGFERAEAALRHRRARRRRADGGVWSRPAAIQSHAPELPRCDGGAGAVAGVQRQRRGGAGGEILGPRADGREGEG